MGYNTRRVSLSLPSLGIHLPGTHAASRAHHKSSHSSASATPTSAGITKSSVDSPPAKRIKRSHTLNAVPESTLNRTSLPSRPRKPSSPASSQPASPPRQQKQEQKEQEQQPKVQRQSTKQSRRPSLLGTPPPSPRAQGSTKIDTEGINDDIVVGVLEQLQSTGNRPHLIKDFVAVLINTLSSVESSQNPTAIISSRLTNYLKRPWTALAPCPLTKEQVTVHPRRVYYYLTTMPRQEIPEYVDNPMAARHVISPSVSSGPDDDDEIQAYMASQRSPSPEVDFASADDIIPSQSFVDVPFDLDVFPPEQPESNHHPREQRLASPPLEHDEREFTHTASVMQLRKQSEEAHQKQQQLLQESMDDSSQVETAPKDNADSVFEPSFQPSLHPAPVQSSEEDYSAEATAIRNQEAAVLLFGQSHGHLLQSTDMSSPLMRPQQFGNGNLSVITSTPRKASSIVDGSGGVDMDIEDCPMFDAYGAWGDLKSPEHVELAELDDMFGAY